MTDFPIMSSDTPFSLCNPLSRLSRAFARPFISNNLRLTGLSLTCHAPFASDSVTFPRRGMSRTVTSPGTGRRRVCKSVP